MIYSPLQLANRLKLIRQRNGWTQSELAKKVGLKQATISHFENAPDSTSLATLFKLLQSLELSLEVHEKEEAGAPQLHDEDEW
ncbi:type II toxin-antitoxin system antitoxin HipB [Pantoea agglomerans]|jgi:HTH-type transcriptional regulator/antitoxin HipB|uniref:HTH-type transcriptional regulator/antitoxin HipB n=1 Tax=[Curtobacterium] plantarum TaxID=221276 RepID=A0ABT9T6U7_9GAMM|nr:MULTISPECIES: type II toxin-antitoxin system antitoxin HipB [Pantoea]MBA8868023.1 HTH-type transcriptional regulator/antitoxin HipB [Pantoea agglomerans]MBA8873023.1 HTH-type transcriptional regulator/antitoxin HipB [Pantoea agglomerans]MDQ0018860.1 HTH-type transcriptional regulator/antitoxin HipB [[Curtobacterium] plantarum]QAV44637.1 type II toxin-antitoxin system antitoxin HipB [Pantoea agglomerans]QAV49477.1 type II toxin-antitoxin system antitoxin HipB [Pantoea agglomerans]